MAQTKLDKIALNIGKAVIDALNNLGKEFSPEPPAAEPTPRMVVVTPHLITTKQEHRLHKSTLTTIAHLRSVFGGTEVHIAEISEYPYLCQRATLNRLSARGIINPIYMKGGRIIKFKFC